MKKHKNIKIWFLIGIASALLSAPNATIIKSVSNDMDTFVFIALRFSLLSLIAIPYFLLSYRKFNKKNFRYAAISSLYMVIAVISYVWSVALSSASYATIITLLTPIALIYFSNKLTNEKINIRVIVGIALGLFGAFVIIGLPFILHQTNAPQFYPFATFLALLNVVSFPLAIIYSKKSNDSGLPLTAVLGVSSVAVFIVSMLVVLLTIRDIEFTPISTAAILSTLYSAVIVTYFARIMHIASYERIGSAAIGALTYLEIFAAITLPLIVLHETLSVEMIIGGLFILAGVIVVEYRKSKHHKHYHSLKNQ